MTGAPYENEYMTVTHFKEGKVVHLKEMVDSLYTSRTLPAMEAFRAVHAPNNSQTAEGLAHFEVQT